MNCSLGIVCERDGEMVLFELVEALRRTFKAALPHEEDRPHGRLVPLHVSSKAGSVFVGCDFSAFTCHRLGSVAPIQYLVSLNAPLLVHNYLPRPLEISVFRVTLIKSYNSTGRNQTRNGTSDC